jgi:hypothetical protein
MTFSYHVKATSAHIIMSNAQQAPAVQQERKTPAEKLEYQRIYNEAHAEKIRAYQHQYYEARRTEKIEQQKERYKKNPEQMKKAWSKYAKDHREEINERRRGYGTYDCDCGSKNLLVCNRTTHQKSNKHLKHQNSLVQQ